MHGQRTVRRTGPSVPAAARPTRRLAARGIRKLLLALVSLVVLLAVLFGLLMLITPSAVNGVAAGPDFRQRAPLLPTRGRQVPFRFAAALEATEDHRFTQEPGIDPLAVGRVFYGYLVGKGDQGGDAPINAAAGQNALHAGPGECLGRGRAGRPGGQACGIGYSFGSEILRLYADVAYFGHGYYGLQDASCSSFGVQP